MVSISSRSARRRSEVFSSGEKAMAAISRMTKSGSGELFDFCKGSPPFGDRSSRSHDTGRKGICRPRYFPERSREFPAGSGNARRENKKTAAAAERQTMWGRRGGAVKMWDRRAGAAERAEAAERREAGASFPPPRVRPSRRPAIAVRGTISRAADPCLYPQDKSFGGCRGAFLGKPPCVVSPMLSSPAGLPPAQDSARPAPRRGRNTACRHASGRRAYRSRRRGRFPGRRSDRRWWRWRGDERQRW